MAKDEVQIPIGVGDNADVGLKQIGAKIKANLEGWKKMAGEESVFGNTFKALQGAGALAGLTLAGNALKTMAEKAATLREEYSSGTKDAQELGKELAESVPVLGNFVTAAYSLREIVTGERDAIRQVTESAAATERYVAARYKTERDLKDVLRDQADYMAEMRRESNLIGKTGVERQRLINQNAADADFKKIREQAAADKDKEGKDLQKNEADILNQIKAEEAKQRPSFNAFDPHGSGDAARAFDIAQAATLAALNKRLSDIRQGKLTYEATIDQGAAMKESAREGLRQKQDEDISKAAAREYVEKARQRARDDAEAEGELRRRGMGATDAARDKAYEARRFALDDLDATAGLTEEEYKRRKGIINRQYGATSDDQSKADDFSARQAAIGVGAEIERRYDEFMKSVTDPFVFLGGAQGGLAAAASRLTATVNLDEGTRRSIASQEASLKRLVALAERGGSLTTKPPAR